MRLSDVDWQRGCIKRRPMFPSPQSRSHDVALFTKSGRSVLGGWLEGMAVAFSLPKGRHNRSRLLPIRWRTEANEAAGGVSFPRETCAARVSPSGVAY